MTVLTRASRCARRVAPHVVTDFSLVAQVLAWRCVLPLVKHVVTTATLARLMWWPPAATVNNRDRAQRIALVQELMATGRLLFSANCLERSLVVYRLLSRADADPALVLGVRKNDGGVGGHAWIQLDGEPFGERNAGDFDPIVVFGRDGVICQSPGLRLAS